MFIRFVCDRPHPVLNAELGMFAARDDLDFSNVRGSIQRAHEEAFYWFKTGGMGGLTYPDLKGKVRTAKIRKSLFWFPEDAKFLRDKSGTVVLRARNLAQAIPDAGVEVREIRMRNPGEILYEDSQQVLAHPGDLKIPRAFK